MKREKLDKERLEPCMAELYKVSLAPNDNVCPQSYEMWEKYGIWAFEDTNKSKPVTMVPMDCFHLDSETFSKIVEKYTKGLHGFWYYMPKLDYNDPDYEAKTNELHAFRDFEAEVHKDKSLTYAQRSAKIKKEALAHHFQWRSNDAEYVSFNVHLGPGPCSDQETVNRLHKLYEIITDLFESGTIKVVYKDFVHMDEFPYISPSGNILTARKVEADGRIHCMCYDDAGNMSMELWDYVNITRAMSATTMEIQIQELKPMVHQKLKELGWDEADTSKVIDHYADTKLKQVVALYLMTKKYQADSIK